MAKPSDVNDDVLEPEVPIVDDVTPVPEPSNAPDVTPGENPDDPPEPAPAADDGVQKRINEITRKRREAEREAAYWRGRAEAQASAPATPNTPEAPEAPVELDPDDFQTYADYHKAVAARTAEQLRKEDENRRAAEEKSRQDAEFIGQINSGRTKYSDFDDVALGHPYLSQEMLDASRGENLDDILYHLGKNPKEAQRIYLLPPGQQSREVFKLVGRLSVGVAPPKPKPTNAPTPPVTVDGASPVEKPDDKKSQKELFAKWERDAKIAKGINPNG